MILIILYCIYRGWRHILNTLRPKLQENSQLKKHRYFLIMTPVIFFTGQSSHPEDDIESLAGVLIDYFPVAGVEECSKYDAHPCTSISTLNFKFKFKWSALKSLLIYSLHFRQKKFLPNWLALSQLETKYYLISIHLPQYIQADDNTATMPSADHPNNKNTI